MQKVVGSNPISRFMGATGKRALGIVRAVRGFGVMLAGPMLLLAGVIASLISALRSLLHGRLPRPPALAGLGATAAYALLVRPWHLRWGAAPGEEDLELPGIELLPEAGTDIVHAISIDAPPEEVWPWVAQLGQDRGGFYSYEWLENLAGCRMSNAASIHPEWQHREVGETVYLHPDAGLKVTLFEPGRALGIEGWGIVAVLPEDGGTRLIVRTRTPAGLEAAYWALLEIPHFVMERRMLLGIKQRAERADVTGSDASGDPA